MHLFLLCALRIVLERICDHHVAITLVILSVHTNHFKIYAYEPCPRTERAASVWSTAACGSDSSLARSFTSTAGMAGTQSTARTAAAAFLECAATSEAAGCLASGATGDASA
jgi:hypothetical protein